MTAQYIVGELTAFGSHELLAARRFQNSAALLNDIRHILSAKINYLIGYQTLEAAVNALYLKTAENSRTRHRTDSGVHARSVTS